MINIDVYCQTCNNKCDTEIQYRSLGIRIYIKCLVCESNLNELMDEYNNEIDDLHDEIEELQDEVNKLYKEKRS